MRDQENYNQYECPCCFLLWNDEAEEVFNRTIITLCAYCLAHESLLKNRSLLLLRRRMEVFPSTHARHLPEVLQHLFEHVKLNDEEAY